MIVNATLKSRTFWLNIVIAIGGVLTTQLTQMPLTPDTAATATVAVTALNIVMRVLTEMKK